MTTYTTWTTATNPPKEEVYQEKLKKLEEENLRLRRLLERAELGVSAPRMDEGLLDLPHLVISLAEIIAGNDPAIDLPETVDYIKSLIKNKYPYQSSSDHDSYDPEFATDEQLLWLGIAFLSNIECPDEWTDDIHIGFNLYHAVKALDYYLDRPDARR